MRTFEKVNDSKIENLVLSTKNILFCILCCKQTFIEFLCFIYTQGFTTSCKSMPYAISVQSARKSQFWCVMIIFIKKRPVTSVPEVNFYFRCAFCWKHTKHTFCRTMCCWDLRWANFTELFRLTAVSRASNEVCTSRTHFMC